MGTRYLGAGKSRVSSHQLVWLYEVWQNSLCAVGVQGFAYAECKRTRIQHPNIGVISDDGRGESGNDGTTSDVGTDHESTAIHSI